MTDEKANDFLDLIDNYSKDDLIETFNTEHEKKIALILYAKGFCDAMKFCTEELNKT